jgi:hypothetical protein
LPYKVRLTGCGDDTMNVDFRGRYSASHRDYTEDPEVDNCSGLCRWTPCTRVLIRGKLKGLRQKERSVVKGGTMS